MIPKVNKKKKVVTESSTVIEKINHVVVATNEQVLDIVQHTKVVVMVDSVSN